MRLLDMQGTPSPVTLAAAQAALVSTPGQQLITGDGGGNTLTSITGGIAGDWLILKFVDALVSFTTAAAKFEGDSVYYPKAGDGIILFHDGTNWIEFARSNASRAPTTLATLGVGATTFDVASVPVIRGVKTVKVAGDAGGNNVTTITNIGTGVRLVIIGITATFTLKAALGKLPGGADIVVTADDIVMLHYDGTTIRTVSVSTNA